MRIQPLSLVFQQCCHDQSCLKYNSTKWCASRHCCLFIFSINTYSQQLATSQRGRHNSLQHCYFPASKTFFPTCACSHLSYCTLTSCLVRLLFCDLVAVTMDGDRKELSTTYNPGKIFKRTFPSEL